MPKSLHVLTLLTLQLATVAGGLALAAAPAASPRQPSHSSTGTSSVRPMAIALLRPVPAQRRHKAVRPAARVKRQAPAPARTHRTAHSAPVPRPAPRLTFQQQVDRAAARITGYRSGSVIWVLQANDGHWGTADWYAHTVWISPTVPSNRLFDVLVHEWSHLQSVAVYDGDVNVAVREMARYFGGAGLVGAERAADCMARLEGAQWTHYTTCTDSRWRAGAARLLAGQRL
jgi:hypothetical protein